MRLSMAEVYEVASFYAHFDIVLDGETAPPAVTVRVCDSLTCAFSGGDALLESLLNPNSYQKGGWVLHMLRKEVGDDQFWAGMRDYYRKFTLSNALTSDLKEVFEVRTGKDLDPFFDQWIFQAGQPELDVKWSYANGDLKIAVDQKQNERFVFTLEADIVYPDGKSDRITIPVDKKQMTWSGKAAGKPLRVVVDPDVWLLAETNVAPQ